MRASAARSVPVRGYARIAPRALTADKNDQRSLVKASLLSCPKRAKR